MRPEQRDSYLQRFRSHVLEVDAAEDEVWVRLAESAFYPTSGGQPHDTGRLDGWPVVDVALRSGEVWHRLQDGAPTVGQEIAGVVDWERRYRHMQRHSAQHLLSQAFVRVSPAFETRSVSLRGADCTVDLAGDPGDDELRSAEHLANAFGYAALPVTSFEVTEAELPDYALRRPPKVRGRIRLVAMGDVEIAACGGTHVATTAETLPVKLLGSERVRGGLRRVTFRAGWEALEDYRARTRLTTDLVQRLSTPLDALGGRIVHLQEELAEARAAQAEALRRRAVDTAEELLRAGRQRGGVRVVSAEVDDELLDVLAEVLGERAGVAALLASRDDARVRLAFTRGPGRDLDLRPALQAALEEVEGRGGGRPERVQGAGKRPEALERALLAAWEALPQT